MTFSITKQELACIDERIEVERSLDALRKLSRRLADDLRLARDRLERTPWNSSTPSSRMAPWERVRSSEECAGESAAGQDEDEAQDEAAVSQGQGREADEPADKPGRGAQTTQAGEAKQPRRPGRQLGAKGHGRLQNLAVDHYEVHHPAQCACCGAALQPSADAESIGGWDVIEWVQLHGPVQPEQAATVVQRLGVRLEVTRHRLMQQRCACGHVTAARPHRVLDDPELWPKVRLGEQRLLGPQLASVVVYLVMRMRCPRRKVREAMLDLFGLQLSLGLIAQTVLEAGRAAEAHDEALTRDLLEATVLHADETPWLESGALSWLWVFCSLATALYVIGPRTAEMLANVLSPANFRGVLMSDGYVVYREFINRLRCWAHLARKIRGLVDSNHQRVAEAGRQFQQQFDGLMQAVYAARQAKAQQQAPPPHEEQVAAFRRLCEQYRDTSLPKVGELAREFLRDWDTIMRPLAEPHLPLTNNHGERTVRHHVQARHITFGTRSMAGTRAYAWLASVIDTCHLRGTCCLPSLAATIAAARKGLAPPPLPPIPQRLRGWDAVSAC
jgi:transposase